MITRQGSRRQGSARPPKVTFAPSRARGQALILSVICLLVFCVGLIVLFNTGQVVNKKLQLTNTADAAAYSAAVQEARALNLIAYLNRAQVANEVTVAQMVSMHSWVNFMINGTDNIKSVVEKIGLIADFTIVLAEAGAALEEFAQALQEIKTVMIEGRNIMQSAFSVATVALSAANEAYSGASFLVAESQVGDIPNVVTSVVKANTAPVPGGTDKEASVSTLGMGVLVSQAELATRQYIKTYNVPSGNAVRNADADRLLNVVMEARDGFSKDRNTDAANHAFDIKVKIPFVIDLFMGKRGGTDLINYNHWVAMDSLSFKFSLGPCTFFGACTKVDLPMAYGGAAATKSPSANFQSLANPGVNNGQGWTSPYDIDNHVHIARYNGAMDNNKAGQKALSNPAQPSNRYAIISGYLGLHSYEDIAKNKATVPYGTSGDVGPIFSVVVEQKMADVRTSSNVAGIGGPPDFQVPDSAPNNAMTALASGQTYFDRPRTLFPRDDKEQEMGNLFSPYWQARLVDTPEALKASLFGAGAVGL